MNQIYQFIHKTSKAVFSMECEGWDIAYSTMFSSMKKPSEWIPIFGNENQGDGQISNESLFLTD